MSEAEHLRRIHSDLKRLLWILDPLNGWHPSVHRCAEAALWSKLTTPSADGRSGCKLIRALVKSLCVTFPRESLFSQVGSLTLPFRRGINHPNEPASGIRLRSISGKMAYTPQHIANYFLDRAAEEGRTMSPMKLIKLVYIAYGWALALLGTKLFDEPVQAWRHGPVIPSLYHEFKHYRSKPIDERAISLDLDTFTVIEPEIGKDDQDTRLVLDKVWSAYKLFSGSALREKTHQPDTPWSQVYREGRRNIVIPDDLIREHYRERIKSYISAARAA